MTSIRLLILCLLIIPSIVFGQRKQKIKGNQINVTTSLSFSTEETNFFVEDNRKASQREYELEFLTPTSGLFELDFDTILIKTNTEWKIPAPSLKLGFAFQFVNPNQIYHEIQLRSLVSTNTIEFRNETQQLLNPPFSGYEYERLDTTHSFTFDLNYELGKYIRNIHKKKIMFGVGINFGFDYLNYSRGSNYKFQGTTFDNFIPIEGSLLDIKVGFASSIWFKLSNQFSLEFKYNPNMRIATIGYISYENPALPFTEQRATRVEELPESNHHFQIGLKMNIKDFDYGRRRRR